MKALRRIASLALSIACCAAAAPSADPVYAHFLGNWTCMTENGTHVDMQFSVENGDLHVHAPWHKPSGSGWTDHTIAHRPGGGYAATYKNSSGWTFSGTGPGFAHDAMTFTGVQVTDKHENDTSRETFRLLAHGDKLDHVWEMQTSQGQWLQVSAAHCTRSSR